MSEWINAVTDRPVLGKLVWMTTKHHVISPIMLNGKFIGARWGEYAQVAYSGFSEDVGKNVPWEHIV